MLLIPVCLKPSRIHGLGVFCSRDLRAETCVWTYRDVPDFRILAEALPESGDWAKHAKHFGYQPRGQDYIEFCGDQALFINHSFKPNLRIEENGDMTVIENLQAGTELTCNYFELEEFPERDGKLI